jgi:hypothetical protein
MMGCSKLLHFQGWSAQVPLLYSKPCALAPGMIRSNLGQRDRAHRLDRIGRGEALSLFGSIKSDCSGYSRTMFHMEPKPLKAL